jgi:hypothetical protein
MKNVFGMTLLLASFGLAACGSAPGEGVDSTGGAAPATASTVEPKVELRKISELKPDTTFAACTAAEREACERKDPGGFGSGCEIENGRVICLLE